MFILLIQSGVTPLYIAHQRGHSDVVSTVITYGADILHLPLMVHHAPLPEVFIVINFTISYVYRVHWIQETL